MYLSYTIYKNGDNRSRTDDLYNAIVALSQLSYIPINTTYTLHGYHRISNLYLFFRRNVFKYCFRSAGIRRLSTAF